MGVVIAGVFDIGDDSISVSIMFPFSSNKKKRLTVRLDTYFSDTANNCDRRVNLRLL
jgi:hypothetical protein